MRRKFCLVVWAASLVATSLSNPAAEPVGEPGWVSLFNGRDLEGWIQHGGKAIYRAEANQIVGSCVPNTPNSFLCTKRSYTNFVLELEFKGQPGLNSGVQIRSQVFDRPTEIDYQGRRITIPAGRVHGYQVEIDPTARAWSGGIYDEGRRGWLQDLKRNDAARAAIRTNDWNKFRIEARGDSIKTWLNGVPAADLRDSLTPAGFIGLQVHGVGRRQEKLEIRFRNLRIQEWP
ncbi:MAG TPA: DUF1080 domain-containing protein [Methylomirabilota bacterium]|nr:DUF1080 domain-containing protein [Methylomirabilota bacterium]